MKKILAIALIFAGFGIFVMSNIFVGLMILIIGLNLISTEGAEINLTDKTFRNIKSIFGLKFGKWKPCPEFEYVSVFKAKESTQISAYGATMGTFKTDIIMLNVFYKGNKHITFYKTDDKNDAFEVAEHFKLALDIDILDATTDEKRWL
ncbi:hypothetical protein Q767_15285 [Flavobacterium enshiense DK69]|uniref:Uncharacterized protein n=2 Tax=Flavobacterium TaxID=237 RepID=A0A0A2MMW6_9FLAO|nr:hypothetical protein Q767_15285 [Flavobacterium enshiense DK69]